MSGRIPRNFIDDLLARTDIVELIDGFVPLKKAGKNHQACCPFHNENTPSFTVSQEKQFYHCFGCGAHGNAISFLMEYESLNFPEAVEELARYHHLPVPRETAEQFNPRNAERQKSQHQSDVALLEKVSQYFEHQLKHHQARTHAVNYLKQRGLNGEIVKQYNIGYAADSWNDILTTFGTSADQRQQLLQLKVITESEQGRQYDFFRNRIVFPIRDKRGRVVAFGGRVVGDGTPKYLNSPETRVFHKSNELYGFFQAKQANRKLAQVVVVEGYMDVVALAQFGITYAVAALGTATTTEQLQMLFRSTKRIICCYDGDRAGREAAWRALNNALPLLQDGVQMQFLFLPDGEDPDTMVRKVGKAQFEQELQQAQPLSQFMFDNLMQRHSVTSAEGKAALKAEAHPLIAKVPGEFQRQGLEEILSELNGEWDKQKLQRDTRQAGSQTRVATVGFQAPQTPQFSPGRMMLRLLLDNPAIARQCPEVSPSTLAKLNVGNLAMLIEMVTVCLANPDYRGAEILEHFRTHPFAKSLGRLLAWDHAVTADAVVQVYQDSFKRLIDWHLQGRMEELLSKARLGKISTAEKQELSLLVKHQG